MPYPAKKQNQLSFDRSLSKAPYRVANKQFSNFHSLQRTLGNQAVQRMIRSDGNFSGEAATKSIHSTAARGTQAPGKTFPFLNLIQRAFGRHDVSHARAHEGSSATSAAKTMGAIAYTTGHHVAFATAPDLHTAAHEAAHIVQQRAGVRLAGHVSKVGDVYERHADRVADRVVRGQSSEELLDMFAPQSCPSQVARPPVVQCKKVPEKVDADDFGQFETTKFQPLNDSGVDIVLMFHPNKDKADATKIALTQSVKATTAANTAYAISPTTAKRMVAGKQGRGYTIDASGATNNPIYFDTKNLGPQDELKDTPESEVPGQRAQLGSNTNYELGYCFREKPDDADKKVHSAGISDKPQGIKRKGHGMMFETAALAIDGIDKGQYYGSVKWGYKIGGTKANPKVEAKDTFDISRASKGTPTANFIEAAKLWNVSTTMGTLEVNPTAGGNKRDAYVESVQGTGPKRLAKGTKLKLVRVVKGSSEGVIEAEVLDASGQSSGTIVRIYVADVKDPGSGTPNKPLPTK